ncbi:CoA-binding protein [Amycolatopsis palatopharyngis]|uniref:CoA-binding protein n=1 Tax=Amycolatopsis palatopharyngis TaxID=187982 RepID=UPI000E23EBA2|nr:CoA-binding protein [Amycolatopsis palatopharyngis]
MRSTLFTPASVAILGATDNLSKLISYRPIQYLKDFGFQGSIYPVNPKYDAVQGLPCYPSLDEIPDVPEAVVVSLPREAAVSAVRQAADLGVRTAIVYSSGFAEVPDGRDLQGELSALGHSGIDIVGPNCQGLAHVMSGYFPCFSTAFATGRPRPGTTAIISQSGAVAAMLYNRWHAVGGGISYWAATGNEAHLHVADVAGEVLPNDDVDLVMIYVESIKDARAFDNLARRAAELGKHMIVYRSTLSADAWTAAGAHTGTATPEPDDDQALREHPNLWVARSLEETIELGQYLRAPGGLRGPKVAVLSNSGGLGVILTDALSREGLATPPLSEPTQKAVQQQLPGFASARNPVDVTAQLLNEPHLLAKALPPLLDDPHVDGLVVGLGAVGDGYDLDAIRDDLTSAARNSDKLVTVAQVGSSTTGLGEHFGQADIPVFDSPAALAAALAGYGRRTEARARSADAASADSGHVRRFPGPPAPRLVDLTPGATYTATGARLTAERVDAYADVVATPGAAPNTHTSCQLARAAGYPGRVVAGLQVLSALNTLGHETGLWAHSEVQAGFDDVRMLSPTFEDDEISMEMVVDRVKELSPVNGERRGLVTFNFILAATSTPDGDTEPPKPRQVIHGQVTYLFGNNGDEAT